jgi:hypothetical protein
MKNMLGLADLERQIHDANLNPNNCPRSNALWIVACFYTSQWTGNIDTAVRSLWSTDSFYAPSWASNIERAFDIALQIPDGNKRSRALRETIICALITAGNIDRAFDVALLIPDKETRSLAYQEIAWASIRAGNDRPTSEDHGFLMPCTII